MSKVFDSVRLAALLAGFGAALAIVWGRLEPGERPMLVGGLLVAVTMSVWLGIDWLLRLRRLRRQYEQVARDIYTILSKLEIQLGPACTIHWEGKSSTDQSAVQPLQRIVANIRSVVGDKEAREIAPERSPDAPIGIFK